MSSAVTGIPDWLEPAVPAAGTTIRRAIQRIRMTSLDLTRQGDEHRISLGCNHTGPRTAFQ